MMMERVTYVETKLTLRRLVFLGAASMIVPGALATEAILDGKINTTLIVGGSAALFVLVSARAAGMIRERTQSERALRRSEASLAEAQRMAHLGNWDWDLTTGEVWWSDEVYCIYGLEPGQGVPKLDALLMDVVHPLDRKVLREAIDAALHRGEPYDLEHRVVHPEGGVRIVHGRAEVVRDEKGEPLRMVGTVHDITERKQAEERLREAEERYRLVARATNEVIWDHDLTTNAQLWDGATEAMFGYSLEELGDDAAWWEERLHPEDRERVLANADAAHRSSDEKTWTEEYRFRHADGSYVTVVDRAYLVCDAEDRPVRMLGSIMDVTERKRAEERLEHQALHDALTGLPRRALFMARLEHGMTRAKRRDTKLAVLFMDLDNFKLINDSLGHEAGDQLLTGVSERVQKVLRREDTVARLGGDEFVILLEDLAQVSEAVRLAEQIAEAVQTPFALEGHQMFVTASLGIAFSDSGHDRPAELLREADAAMYRAKEQGGVHVFEPSMHIQAKSRLELENGLREALEREEFRVYYQPQVNLQTGKTVGFEALVRWDHPTRGLLRPSEFIPVAEETGIIVPLGWWVLREACRQTKEWHERYASEPPLLINVNFSTRQLKRPGAVETVERILKDTGLEPHCLNVDIIETALIAAADEEIITTLKRLRELGVWISIDDFGTGYSSLAYLKRLPVDILKVDKSFMDGLVEDVEDLALVHLIVDTAHTLGMHVVAEGVESAEQAKQLKEMGCDIAQGRHFSEPLPPQPASVFLTDNDTVALQSAK